MPELLSPGVFVQEVPFGPQPIEGVSTSTTGLVGEALRGPTAGPPTLVTSFADFERKFGGLVPGKTLGYAVQGFFDNGGRRAYISRVAGGEAASASLLVPHVDHSVALTGASTVVAAKLNIPVATVVGVGFGSPPGSITLVRKSDGATKTRTITGLDSATRVITVAAFATPDESWNVMSPATHYVKLATGNTGNALTLNAKSIGAGGNRLSAIILPVLTSRATIRGQISTTKLELSDVSFLASDERLHLAKLDSSGAEASCEIAVVDSVDPGTRILTTTAALAGTYTDGDRLFLIAWRVVTLFDGEVVEQLDGISTAVTGSSAEGFRTAVAQRSQWLVVGASPANIDIDPSSGDFPTFGFGQPQLLAGGSDGAAAVAADVVGSVGARTGLGALEGQDGINLIAAPGFTDKTVVNALISQAERLQDRFAVFESTDAADVNTVLVERGRYNSNYAAMYHPWLRIQDPVTRNIISVPPSGHVLGAYARTDNDRGVFKAPANVVLRGVLAFTRDVSTGEQDVLNPAGVNVLRHFDGLGDVIWGARTVTSDSLWKYVSVRRLFIFLEQSISRGTRYAVFEPNAQPLWARIRDSVTNFLTTQWRSGALFGATPAQAFFVKVDETTTTQDDRDNGRVNILVGIAPVKPAEFVVFQIGQAPGSVIIAERG